MKVKKFNKSLTLNKRTVAHLDRVDMKDARGGTGTTWTYQFCTTSDGFPCHYSYCDCNTGISPTCLMCTTDCNTNVPLTCLPC